MNEEERQRFAELEKRVAHLERELQKFVVDYPGGDLSYRIDAEQRAQVLAMRTEAG